MADSGVFGFAVLDKPAGLTSNAALSRVRRILGTKRAGHTGTLDPFATGVLVVAVGRATRLIPLITGDRKRYRAVLSLGVATDTLDSTGEVVATAAVPDYGPEELAAAARALSGRQLQKPPVFSAKKIAGVRAHDLARRGEAPDLAPVEVEIYSLAILPVRNDPAKLAVEVECSRGTYVRSLGESIAAHLGTVGHLSELRRTYSDGFDVEEAVALEEFSAGSLLPLGRVLAGFAVGFIEGPVLDAARHGHPFEAVAAGVEDAAEGSLAAVFAGPLCERSALGGREPVGVYRLRSGRLVPEMVLAG
ncbi:MAG: tRNA pseudouridine(55) synthase TruB [Actinomycetota bacterium]|nr:tRNA pseudouridine(55) synthase TruB [Actinomycetota bacterium]